MDESPPDKPEPPQKSRAAAPRAAPEAPEERKAAAPRAALSLAPAAAASAAPEALNRISPAAGSPVSHLDDAMPSPLQEQLTNLETWAQSNRRDSKLDAIKFWSLKIPAIVVAAGSGVSAYYELKGLAVIAGAVASLCVLIDALNPGGALRNAHLRAFNELRILQERMKSEIGMAGRSSPP